MRPDRLAAVAALLILGACASTPKTLQVRVPVPARNVAPAEPVPTAPPPTAPSPGEVLAEGFSDLPGWPQEDHAGAFRAFLQTCMAARDADMAVVCRRAGTMIDPDEVHARAFFEDNFRPERLSGEGLLTAYFAPEYEARTAPDEDFFAPVRPRPADLMIRDGQAWKSGANGTLTPYPDRAAIEAQPSADALAWMRPEDLFFLQVQGSGVLTYEDGRREKVLYAGNNGQAFVGIAAPMRRQGLLPENGTSGEAIRAWLSAHRGPEAEAVMRLNPRYAFFRTTPDDGTAPLGAAGLPLPSGRAIAVDPRHHGYGELIWIDADAPNLSGAFPAYQRLVSALDTGGAIKGEIRADLYLGQGAAAGLEAGRVRHVLRMHKLVPRP